MRETKKVYCGVQGVQTPCRGVGQRSTVFTVIPLCLFLSLLLCIPFSLAATVSAKDRVAVAANDEKTAPVVPWWKSERITATGRGFPKAGLTNFGQAKALAKQAAMADACRNLAQVAAGVRITAKENITDSKVNALVKGAVVVSERYDADGSCTVEMIVPLYGVQNSVAQTVLEPTTTEPFPPPGGSGVTKGDYTGLVIDCSDATRGRDAKLTPVLTPKILGADKKPIYGVQNLSHATVVEKGMIGYTDAELVSMVRTGDNPLVVKAVGMQDDNSTPILSAEDTEKVLRENAVSHFLDEGAVVFKSTRGMRDSFMGGRGGNKSSRGNFL